MIGTNELKLNEATMIEVVEYWLTNKVLRHDSPAPRVASVKASNNGYDSQFTVTLEERVPDSAVV